MPNSRRYGKTSRSRGKLVRQTVGTFAYTWKPIDRTFNKSTETKTPTPVEPCVECDGLTVDNVVQYVYGGKCPPNGVSAYVDCDYIE